MSDQQEDFHIDVGCYSPPTSTIATIIGANGAQPTGGHQNLDPQWVQPSSNHHDGASFDLPLGLETITSPIPTQTIHYPPQMEQLGDFDALVPLPEHLLDTMPNEITPLDPAPFLHDLQEDLVPLTTNPVPTSSTDMQLLICRNHINHLPKKRAVQGLTTANHNRNKRGLSFILTQLKLDQRKT